MRKFLVSPAVVGNGVFWLVAVAMQIGGWANALLAYILLGVAFVWSVVTAVSYKKAKKREKEGIAVKPSVGRRHADWDKAEHFMWAELQVMNTGSTELKDVQVNITKCLTLQETQDSPKQNDFTMFDFLKLAPFCVYWSERQSQPKQIALSIPSGATRSALIAFQDNRNGGSFNFNTANYNWVVGGTKIDIEVSSCETVLWRGEFYLECYPNYLGGHRAKFDFAEWDTWIKDKNITLLDQQFLQSSKCD